MPKLFLYGPPASGKTALGGKLAGRLHLPFVDLDAEIERTVCARVADIFAREGEEGFRVREREMLERIASDPEPCVCALGGGALLREGNRDLCERNGEIIFLDMPVDVLARRAANTPGKRPLLAHAGSVEALLSKRAAHYAAFPNRVTQVIENGGVLTLEGRNVRRVFEALGYGTVDGLETRDSVSA